MHGLFCPAKTAFHLAAPMERTRAPLDDGLLLSPVPSTTAHQVAAVHSYRCFVALTTVRAENPEPWVAFAESRRRLVINQVLGSRWLVVWVVRLQLEGVSASFTSGTSTVALASQAARVAHHDPGSSVKAVLEIVANDSETGESHPTRFHSARSGHTVTLAFLSHLGGDVL